MRASDGQLYSETTVVIDVLDVNDCPPKFSEANYSTVIQVIKTVLKNIYRHFIESGGKGVSCITFLVTTDIVNLVLEIHLLSMISI